VDRRREGLPSIEKRSGLELAESQRTAIRLALTAKALVITGGPGVGETTIVNSILGILAVKPTNGRPPSERKGRALLAHVQVRQWRCLGIGDWAHTQEWRPFCFFHFVHFAAIG
jgi:hypothetical protein